MDYSQLGYPNYETPLLQAYGGRFSAAFIALHPFFRMPASVEWETVSPDISYPDNPYIRKYGQPVYWQTIMQAIDCDDVRRFYIGMFTESCALQQEYQDRKMARQISEYTKQLDIFYPMEGFFNPLLIEPITQYISHEQTDDLFYLREFEKEPEVLSVETAIQECDLDGPLRGSLFDVNVTRLTTVDWDDFFTVIYGSNNQLASLLANSPMEGFFCDEQTLHSWCWQD
jgi:hypothetical protein